jgi:hypothetical protein
VTPERALALFHPEGDPDNVVLVVDDSVPAREFGDEALIAVSPRARRTRAALERKGFRAVLRLAHAPDISRSRFVFPLRDPASRFAVEHIPLHSAKRAVARVLARAGVLPSTTLVYRAAGARPLLRWLSVLGEPRARCSALVEQSWRGEGAAVVFRFVGDSTPDLVVKVGAEAGAEAAALRKFGTSARAAGADVPRVVADGMLADEPMAAQTFVMGVAAFDTVRGSVSRAEVALRSLAGWLERWNAATLFRRRFTQDDVEMLSAIARSVDTDVEVQTRRLAQACVGTTVPFVAAHNDLTSVNVLVQEETLGVVDWSSAGSECLPLGDLAYAAADLAAALDGYRDRVASFKRGELVGTTSSLVRRLADSLALEPMATDLCLHACWLRHAANERGPGPFREILRLSLHS